VFADRRLVIAFAKYMSLNLCHIIMFSVTQITYCSTHLYAYQLFDYLHYLTQFSADINQE